MVLRAAATSNKAINSKQPLNQYLTDISGISFTDKGEMIIFDGTDLIKLPIGVSNGLFLQLDNTTPEGAAWRYPATEFDATVGATGAQYTTVAAAIAAGKKAIVVVFNTTEPADITLSQTTKIYVAPSALWDVGDITVFYPTGGGADFYGEGNLKWSPTTSKFLFDANGTSGNRLFITNLQVDCSGGTAADCPLFSQDISNGVIIGGRLLMFLPDFPGYGIHPGASEIEFSSGFIVFIQVGSGGTNCYNVLSGIKDYPKVILVGLFAADPLKVIDTTGGTISALSYIDFASQPITVGIGGALNGFSRQAGTGLLNVIMKADGSSLQDCNLAGGYVDVGSFNEVTLSNIRCSVVNNSTASTYFTNVSLNGYPYPIIKNQTLIDENGVLIGDTDTISPVQRNTYSINTTPITVFLPGSTTTAQVGEFHRYLNDAQSTDISTLDGNGKDIRYSGVLAPTLDLNPGESIELFLDSTNTYWNTL